MKQEPKDKEQNIQESETREETFSDICDGHLLGIDLTQSDQEALLKLCDDYHAARVKIEAENPVMSLQECKDEVARMHGKPNWLELWNTVYNASVHVEGYMEEAAELYAKQFSKPVVYVSDEEINNRAVEFMTNNFIDSYQVKELIVNTFITASKEMRDKTK